LPKKDDVKNLPHYTRFKIQPIEFFRANKEHLCFMAANVIKYVCRYRFKNGKEDLLKARNYIDMMIEEYYPELTKPTQPLCGYCKQDTASFTCTDLRLHNWGTTKGQKLVYRCGMCKCNNCQPINGEPLSDQ
jgi:hypothetical protein